jgi:butyryl-CoA dehydrogenase
MFIMMNAARFAVGMQGVAVSEHAYQKAAAYAKERVQSRAVEGSNQAVAIIRHPDVQRMLLYMRANTEAARAVGYVAAAWCDVAHHHPDEAARRRARALYEYLVPIVKGWSTEMSIDVASIGIQVHGGMGYIEETGAAQFFRDARILTIYEGTTAIQANDLVGRKTVRDGGVIAKDFVAQMKATLAELERETSPELAAIQRRLAVAIEDYSAVVDYVAGQFKNDIRGVFAGSVPYLKLAGVAHGGWQMARAALIARRRVAAGAEDGDFLRAKIATARFHAEHILPLTSALRITAIEGGAAALSLAVEQF